MIPYLDIPVSYYLLALLGSLCLGISKTGLPGLALINVVLMAEMFEKESVGIVLPLLIVCDLIIYPMYRRYASWRQAWPLIIPAVVGVLIGYFVLKRIDDQTTKIVIGWTIIGMLILQVVRHRSEALLKDFPASAGFQNSSGLVIGISTTVANAAGPAIAIWALVRGITKEDFLGIGARVFLFLNLFKIPFNAEIGIINERTLLLDAALLPAIFIGIAIGRQIVMRIPQKKFEWVLFWLSAAGAIWLVAF